jgi:hypothetical protein
MKAILVSPLGDKKIDLKNSFWWSLCFGPFYFASVGLWSTAIISFFLAVISGGISVLIYPFFTEKIITSYYMNMGWKKQDPQDAMKNAMGGFACESCGMPMDLNTISKRDIRYCFHCQDPKTGALKPYGQVRSDSIDALMRIMGKTKEEAEKTADDAMLKLPRWKVK